MRICVVSDQAFPAQGGEGVATQNLCVRLFERGHKVILLTSKHPHPTKAGGIEIIRFPSFRFFQKGYFAICSSSQIIPILKKKDIQIIHVNLPTLLGWQSFLAAEKLNIPKVAGFHVQIGNVIPYNLPPVSFLKVLLEFWFSYFYNKPDLLISPSNLGKKILSSYSSCRIEVVSNGIDLSIFNPDAIPLEERREFRKRYGLEDLPFLLYVGRLSKEKNVLYLLEIMQILKEKKEDIKLLIAGEGELRALLKRKIFSGNLDKMITLVGFLPQEDLLCAYREADILILPSLFELQSIVTLEAMAMGCSVLIGKSDQSAARDLVKEGVNGHTFSLKNPFDAAEKINFILSNHRLKESMQKASFEIAKQHDIKKSISKIEKLYSELVS